MIVLAWMVVLAGCGTLVYGTYRVLRWLLGNALHLDVSAERQSMKLRVRDWLQWNVAVNPSKGVASGSMQLNPPVKSSLVIGVACLLMAAVCSTITRVVIPAVFVCFGVYHLARSARRTFRRKELVGHPVGLEGAPTHVQRP